MLQQLRYLAYYWLAVAGERRRGWVVLLKLALLTRMAIAAARYERRLRR